MIKNIGIVVIIVSGGLVWLSEYFAISWMAPLGMMIFGMWVIANGVEIAIKGEATFFNRVESSGGIAAGLWSAIFITFGIGILFFSWLNFSSPSGSDEFMDRLLASPGGWGLVTGLTGLVITAMGIIRLLAASASSSQVSRLEEFGTRLGGLVTTLLGLGLLLLAIGLLFFPDALSALFQWFLEALKDIF